MHDRAATYHPARRAMQPSDDFTPEVHPRPCASVAAIGEIDAAGFGERPPAVDPPAAAG